MSPVRELILILSLSSNTLILVSNSNKLLSLIEEADPLAIPVTKIDN